MIKKITLSNFKGHNRSFDLGAATMIVGDNFKGKTGLFQAIALGVHGSLRHPAGDKKLDPYGLASGNPMQVCLQLDDNIVERCWAKDKKGSVKYSGYEGEPLIPSVLLDARTYFDLSPDKRMRFVFGAVKLPEGEFSAAKLIADLKNLNADPQTEAHEVALKEVVYQVSSSWYLASADPLKATIQEWLSETIDLLKEKAKLDKQAVARMAQTVAGITELQIRDVEQIDANTAGLENQMQNLRTKIAAKQSELGSVEQRIKTAEQKAKQIAGWVAELNTLPKPDDAIMAREGAVNDEVIKLINHVNELSIQLGRLEAEQYEVAQKKDRQESILRDIDKINKDLAQYPDMAESIAKLKEEQEGASTELFDTQRHIEALLAEHETIRLPLSDLLQNHHAQEMLAKEANEKLAKVETATECPWCHCEGHAFKEVARTFFTSQLNASMAAMKLVEGEIRELQQKLADAKSKGATEREREGKLGSAIKVHSATIAAAEAKQNVRKTLLARREELEKQVVEVATPESLNKTIADKQREIFANNSELSVNKSHLLEIAGMKRAKELAGLITDAPEQVDFLRNERSSLLAEKDELTISVQGLDPEVKKSIASKNDVIRQNQAVEERNKAQAEQDMTKLAVECVTEFQQRLVDQAFGSIIANANRFTDGIMESPLVYRDGEIGRMRDGVFVSTEYFSGTEQALTFAAISVALAMQHTFRLVMLDEMTRLSDRNKELVLARMCQLINAGLIHQFVGVDVTAVPYQKTPAMPIYGCVKDFATFIQL